MGTDKENTITVTQLEAFTEAHQKAAANLEKIAGSLATIAGVQQGMARQETLQAVAGKLDEIGKDAMWLKIILGSATLIALLATVFLKVVKP